MRWCFQFTLSDSERTPIGTWYQEALYKSLIFAKCKDTSPKGWQVKITEEWVNNWEAMSTIRCHHASFWENIPCVTCIQQTLQRLTATSFFSSGELQDVIVLLQILHQFVQCKEYALKKTPGCNWKGNNALRQWLPTLNVSQPVVDALLRRYVHPAFFKHTHKNTHLVINVRTICPEIKPNSMQSLECQSVLTVKCLYSTDGVFC